MSKCSRHINLRIIHIFSSISFRYPSSFIDKQFRKFFIDYISSSSIFLRIATYEQQFERMRQNMLRQRTREQSPAELDNNPAENKDNQLTKKMIVHYTHEKRFHCFKRDMHRILDNTFQKQINKDIKLIVGNRNRHNAQKELVRKRPKQSLLKNNIQKSKLLSLININILSNYQLHLCFLLTRTKKNIQAKTNN